MTLLVGIVVAECRYGAPPVSDVPEVRVFHSGSARAQIEGHSRKGADGWKVGLEVWFVFVQASQCLAVVLIKLRRI